MITLNLQYFGGRGSAAGKRSGEKTTNELVQEAYANMAQTNKFVANAMKVGEAMRAIKASAERIAPSGNYIYTENGVEAGRYTISYSRTRDEGGNPTIAQLVDGHEYGGYVTRISEKEYLGSNDVGEEVYTRSYDKAARHAFKLPRGWKKKK